VGFAILFKVDDSCIVNHLHERKSKWEADDAGDEAQVQEKQNQRDAQVSKVANLRAKAERRKQRAADKSGPAESGGGTGGSTASCDYSPTQSSYGPAARAKRRLAVALAGDGGDVDCHAAASTSAAAVDDDGSMAEGGAEDTGAGADTDEEFAYPDTTVELGFSTGAPRAVEEATDAPSRPSSNKPKPLTAKEKRQRKKQKQRAARGMDDSADAVSAAPCQQEQPPVALATGEAEAAEDMAGDGDGDGDGGGGANTQQPGPGQAKRGQKKKKQKAKVKYADQDEEDRMLAMDLLSSAGSAKPVSRKGKRQARKERGVVGSKQIIARGTQSKAAPEAAVAKIQETIEKREVFDGDWDEEKSRAANEAKHMKLRDAVDLE